MLNNNYSRFWVDSQNTNMVDELLGIEHEKVKVNPFAFYETDYEEEYTLYENTIDDVRINFKEFKNYGELEFITDDLNKFNKLISE